MIYANSSNLVNESVQPNSIQLKSFQPNEIEPVC